MNAATPQADFDARISRLEGTVDQMNARLGAIESRLANLESRLDSGFRWIIGIQFATLIALGTLILVKL